MLILTTPNYPGKEIKKFNKLYRRIYKRTGEILLFFLLLNRITR